MASLPRPLPTGRCNFTNLNVKTTDYNTHCGCQTFWLDEGAAQEQTFSVISLSSSSSTSASESAKEGGAEAQSSSSSAGRRRVAQKPRPQQLCICGHHVCYHSMKDDAPSISDRQRSPVDIRQRTPSKQPEHNPLINLSKTFDDRAALSKQDEGFNFVLNAGDFDSSEWRAMGLGPGPISDTDGLGLSFNAFENANYNANLPNKVRTNDGYTGYSSRRNGDNGNLTSEGTLQAGVAAPSPAPSSSITEVATNLSFTPAQQYQPHASINASTYNNYTHNHTSSPLQRAVHHQRFVSNATGLPQQYHQHQSPQHPQYQQLQDLTLPQNRRQNLHELNTQQPQQRQQLHRMTPTVFQEAATGTPTVIDSPMITNAMFHNFTQQAINIFRAVSEIRSLAEQIHPAQQVPVAPSATAANPTPLLLMEAVSPESSVPEEVTRKIMAAEGATKDLIQCLERSRSQVQSDSTQHMTPPQRSSSSAHASSSSVTHARPLPSSPPPPRLAPAATPLSAKSAVSNGSMFASIPPPKLEQTDSSLRAQLQLLREKCEGLEDAIEDAANKAELAEDRVVDMEGRMVNVEDKVDGVAESFSRHKEASSSSSLGKRSREDNELYESHVSKHKRDSKRRRRQKGMGDLDATEHLSKPEKQNNKDNGKDKEKDRFCIEKPLSSNSPETAVKQVTTTTRTSFTTSTCTSFASNASADSGMSYRTERLLSNILTQITSLNARMSALEDLAPPTPNRPWVIEVVVLPPSTWASWKRQDGNLVLKSHAPRALHTGSKAWRRLASRGLIKTVEVVGGEARDVERAIRKKFGGVFRALPDSQSLHSPDVSYEWSPLRKAPKQSNLRFLRATEMEHGFWKADFLKRTCATEIFPPQPHLPPSSVTGGHDPGSTQSHTLQASSSNPRSSESTKRSKKWPTHRLWITNCWTGAFSGAGSWDEMSDYTQVSSRASVAPPTLRRRASSVASTQRSAMGSLRRKHTRGLLNDEESSTPISQTPFIFGRNDTGELGGGWDEVRRLPRYLDDSSDSPSAHRTGASSHTIAAGDHGSYESYWEFDETLDGPAVVYSSEDNTSFTGSSSRAGRITASGSENPITNSSSINSFKHVSLRRRASKSSVQRKEDQGSASIVNYTPSENFVSEEGYFASTALPDESPLCREVPEEDGDEDNSGGLTPRAYSAPTPRPRSPANWRLSQLSSTRAGSYPIGNQYMRRFARLRNPEVPRNPSSDGTTNNRGLISSEVSRLTDFSTDEGVGDDEETDDVGGVNNEDDGDDEEARMRASRSPTEEV